MRLQKISVVALASAIAIAGLGFTSSDAYASGKNNSKNTNTDTTSTNTGNTSTKGGGSSFLEGSCKVTDVFAGTVSASACGNFTGNDSQVGFVDYLNSGSVASLAGYSSSDSTFASKINSLDGTWSLFGKSDEGGDKVNSTTGGNQSGGWSLTESLQDPFVVVLKASNYYSAYLFENYDAAVQSGTFNVKGVTADSKNAAKFADLSHLSVYSFAPRIKEVKPPTIPEPTTVLGLLAVVAMGYRAKRSASV